jgi:molybdopterin molybdotransferase
VPALAIARQAILERLAVLPAEDVHLADADGRILAEDVSAPFDLPRWDNSAMDGFAVRAADCAPDASLPVIGMIAAGDSTSPDLRPGCALQILTGAPMPAGADTVIPFEEVREESGTIRLTRAPEAGDHVRLRGGDIHSGELCLASGRLIGPPEIAILASVGRAVVAVHRRPRVAILSTGNELRPPGTPLGPGTIYDSNGPMLAAAAARAGALPVPLGAARDDADDLRRLLEAGVREDVLVTSAGVSTGERDLVRETLAAMGAEELFYKVAIQPGRPFACAFVGSTCVISLPGNPVAAMLTFELLVRPALRRLQGAHPGDEAPVRARLAADVQPRPDRLTLLRVTVRRGPDGLEAVSAGRQATGFVKTLANADAIATIPAGSQPVPAGSWVDIHFLRHENAMGESTS